MRALIQRVRYASVAVEDKVVGEIGQGVLVFLGIAHHDTEKEAEYLARKVLALRIFEDTEGKMNRSVTDVQGGVLVVSQFTLYADTRKGNRPSFTNAALPEHAERLYEHFLAALRAGSSLNIQSGQFRATMAVSLLNDGPVTILLDTSPQ
ncbi:MAG: D-aminoacyl-tRNA deacylase [Chloroherpetonaceae bacterium]|nr:D-aminoacyl-tRNA deacylase [Chloroherpetonaceae bacterium]MCS7212319.1 D-aminoacyl-tRNA deacylase [Chloroherpetonaceae bacterium]MDW8020083.1 D-aminoacyl-tRNA deacylase [Chloroherpetonaceae bacterium]MDW8464930.1 D-aminoacyl-tRNA deacylase [Chloroherpetonaceae bacterium]